MKSTMQDAPLLIRDILRHGQRVHGDSSVITVEEGGSRRSTFAEVTARAEKLAAALTRIGIEQGDRVGTFCWNNQGHLEAYLAIPAIGAVLHTLNIRLPADQLAYVVNHAEDRCIIVDASLIPLLAAIKDELKASIPDALSQRFHQCRIELGSGALSDPIERDQSLEPITTPARGQCLVHLRHGGDHVGGFVPGPCHLRPAPY